MQSKSLPGIRKSYANLTQTAHTFERSLRWTASPETREPAQPVWTSCPFQLVSPCTGRASHWASVHTCSVIPALIAGVRGW